MKTLTGMEKLIQICARKALMWKFPLNWSPSDWREELMSVAWLAALELLKAEPSLSEAELFKNIMNALKRRWREEWVYASRCVSYPFPSPPCQRVKKKVKL